MSASDLVYAHLPETSAIADAALATALALEAAIGDKSIWTAYHPRCVTRVGVFVTVAVNYDTPTALTIVAFDKRVTYGSDTGRVEMARVTIPNSAPAGRLYFVDIPTGDATQNEDGDLMTGMQVVAEIVQAGTGGAGIAGDFQPMIFWEPIPEMPVNSVMGSGTISMLKDILTVQV